MLRDGRPQTWYGRLLAALLGKQTSYNLLGVEALTHFLETYRTLVYGLSDLKRDFVLLHQEHIAQRQKDEARWRENIEGVQAQLKQLRDDLAAQRKLLDACRG
jgi:hypothetical protein